MRALLLPAEAPPSDVELPESGALEALRSLVGGPIEALNFGEGMTAYGNDEAKLIGREIECPYCKGEGREWDDETLGDPCDGCRGSGRMRVEGLAENRIATAMIYGNKAEARRRGLDQIARLQEFDVAVIDVGSGDPREPFVAGPVVVCGFDPRAGENLPIPEALRAELLACGELLYGKQEARS